MPAALGGLLLLGGGLYIAIAPTSYRDPNNAKMVAYTNSIHPVVVIMGVIFAAVGLGFLWLAYNAFSNLPLGLREYTYEQLRLGQALAREIIRLTKPEEFHSWSVKYDDGSKLYVSAWSYFDRRQSLLSKIRGLNYGFGESVSFTRSQPGTEVDRVLHVPEVRFYIDSFTGKADRHESVKKYEIREHPPLIDEDSPLAYAIRMGELDDELGDVGDLSDLIEPRFEVSRLRDEDEVGVEEIIAHNKFMKQMGLDKPTVEELQIALDQLKEW